MREQALRHLRAQRGEVRAASGGIHNQASSKPLSRLTKDVFNFGKKN
jgi:hypothetical protein